MSRILIVTMMKSRLFHDSLKYEFSSSIRPNVIALIKNSKMKMMFMTISTRLVIFYAMTLKEADEFGSM